MKHHSRYILPVIVIAQFFCTSLWFAGNGVMTDLIRNFGLKSNALAHLTSFVQFGFISGTLVFAILTISDRFSPSKVFLICALSGALFNTGIIWSGNGFISLMILRYCTGFCLAGIYPVGMKIASDHFDKGLGKSLGFLVGALVLGTAFPHLLKSFNDLFPWRAVVLTTSALALTGGCLIYFLIPDGPFHRRAQAVKLSAFTRVFKNKTFRNVAFGYFGHNWELYAFWAFVPALLRLYNTEHPAGNFNVPLLSFFIIGAGGIACFFSGVIAQRTGLRKTAFVILLLSCLCCLSAPLVFLYGSYSQFAVFLLFWGIVVVADSPLFSAMVAQNSVPEIRGTSLTIVNCIGFALTIISIQLLNLLFEQLNSPWVLLMLAIGPVLGLRALSRNTD